MIILAGDIGGTKTWLQLANIASTSPSNKGAEIRDRISILFEQRFASQQYSSFDLLLQEFLHIIQQQNLPLPEVGCIGVAGPVATDSADNDTAHVTNLPWQLDAQQLAKQHQLRRLRLINDFQAVAYGLEMLTDDELMILQQGDVPEEGARSVKAIIGAGTGLGQALLICHRRGGIISYEVVASEGGHGDFAPGSIEQRDLVTFLAERQARVSVEDVLSGRGLVNIYEYLANKYPDNASIALARAMKDGDAAAAVSEAALHDADSLARQAVNLFVVIYGTQAGNYALTCMATGGVYLAGGIAAKIQAFFSKETFLASFHNKGPMRQMMERIPVKLVLNPQVGLKGAASVASRL